jgi:outer membrane protein
VAVPASAVELKIGVVNIAKVMEEAPQAEKARETLEKEFQPREQKLIDVQKEVRGMEERLARDASIMSESERSRIERDVLAKKRDAKRDQDEFREDLQIKRGELMEKLQRELVMAIRDFAQKEKYDIVLAEGVVFMSDKVDVTAQVLERLKKDTAKK